MPWKFWERESGKTDAERTLEELTVQPAPAAPPVAGGFQLTVEDVFSITGRGTVVTGVVTTGTVRVGMGVLLTAPDGSNRQTSIAGIEMFRKLTDTATVGDHVGLLLKDVTREQVSKETVVSG